MREPPLNAKISPPRNDQHRAVQPWLAICHFGPLNHFLEGTLQGSRQESKPQRGENENFCHPGSDLGNLISGSLFPTHLNTT